MGRTGDFVWWKHGVVYQIYPRSFYDSNGDGIGDIPGVTAKLDYLSRLGVDAIWLSPVNTSPMFDFGYDISDYRGIDPVFGTHDDFLRLVREAHEREIRIIMDMVINHTSHLHPWFVESRSSRDNPKRDWYLWHDGRRGRPPNNWMATFGGRAWEWDAATGQYYHHTFLKEQPDLNLRNPACREAVFNELRYWLDLGVDGFRLDAVNWYIKDDLFRSNPPGWGPNAPRPYDLQDHVFDKNRPEIHDVLRELRRLMDGYGERMMVGETYESSPRGAETAASYLGNGSDELHLAFDFSLIFTRYGARHFRRCLERWYAAVPKGGWPSLVLNNHDQPRAVARWCRGRDGMKRARLLAFLLLAARGTPFLYYGEEIGMDNGVIGRREIRDPLGKRYWPFHRGRDPERTPMLWSAESHGGFTAGVPWLPVNRDYRERNVAAQERDPASLLNLYRGLIALRKERGALHRGSIAMLGDHPDILAFYRDHDGERLLAALNFSGRRASMTLEGGARRVLFGTDRERGAPVAGPLLVMEPHEALILE
jgi:alpha-glucosidase